MKTQAAMQTAIDAYYAGPSPAPSYFVSRDNTGTQGYNTVSFPDGTTGLTYYTITYYDDYSYTGAKPFNSTDNISGATQLTNPRSLVTGTKTLVLDGGTTYLMATMYYDDKYRPIQTVREIYDDSNTSLETVSNQYDFIGQLLSSKIRQAFNSVTRIVLKTYTYDHAGRLTKVEQKIDSNTSVTLATLEYNEIGQLKQEKLHVSGSSALQTVKYKYNIRGWLTDINDVTNKGSDLFAMQLLYNSVTNMGSLTAATAQYNGNIAAVKWKNGSSSGDPLQAYGFTYDALDRLRDANYADGSALTANVGKFKETILEYDLNGNIKSLNRSGINGATAHANLDILAYTYTGNQLMKIVDTGQKTLGFVDNNTNTDDYAYDANGNLTKDLNKGFTTLKYNYLNLLVEVGKNSTTKSEFIYDAAGNKVKLKSTIGSSVYSWYYTGIMEYDNNKRLKLIHTDKGIVDVTGSGSSYTFTLEYHIKDHLGNVRTAFKPNGSNPALLQTFNYYPFGAISEANWGSSNNLYTFGGKELNNDNIGGSILYWYDFGARYLDGWTGRWWVPDPLQEITHSWTPFHYVRNNPMNRIDPDGRKDTDYRDEKGQLLYRTDDGLSDVIIVHDKNIPTLEAKLNDAKKEGNINDPNVNKEKMHTLGRTPQEYSTEKTKGTGDYWTMGYGETYEKAYNEGMSRFSLGQVFSSFIASIATDNNDNSGQMRHSGRSTGIEDGNSDRQKGKINRLNPTSSFKNNPPLIILKDINNKKPTK